MKNKRKTVGSLGRLFFSRSTGDKQNTVKKESPHPSNRTKSPHFHSFIPCFGYPSWNCKCVFISYTARFSWDSVGHCTRWNVSLIPFFLFNILPFYAQTHAYTGPVFIDTPMHTCTHTSTRAHWCAHTFIHSSHVSVIPVGTANVFLLAIRRDSVEIQLVTALVEMSH